MLNDSQVMSYFEHGYLVCPGLFSSDEVALIAGEARQVQKTESPQRVMEADGKHVRAIYGVHLLSRVLSKLTCDQRTVECARQLLAEDVYVFQTQLNPKAPFRGDVWEWHQDFLYWSRDDGMPEPKVLSIAVFLDDVTEFNGPIFVIDGSHEFDLEGDTSTYAEGWEKAAQGLSHRVAPSTLAALMESHGLSSVKGSSGTAVVFHGSLLHCSPPNLSSTVRTVLFIRYNAISNRLRHVRKPRPEWVASRDPRPIETLGETFMETVSSMV